MNESTDKPATSRIRSRASSVKQRVTRDGKETIESGKRAAADQIEDIADAIDTAGAQLDQSQPTFASYASKLADGVGGLATRLREDSVEDIYRDVRRLATQHPGWFLVGSAALGVVIARFMKVSSEQLSAETSGGGDEDPGEAIRGDDDLENRFGTDPADGSLYGQANDESNADEADIETLRPAREDSSSSPSRSPNLGM